MDGWRPWRVLRAGTGPSRDSAALWRRTPGAGREVGWRWMRVGLAHANSKAKAETAVKPKTA